MKILFAANRYPYPPFRGDKLKIFNLAKVLSDKHELHLLTFLENEEDEQYNKELQPFFTKIFLIRHPKLKAYKETALSLFSSKPLQVGYFQNKKMAKKINELLEKENYDSVHIQHLRLLPYWEHIQSIPRVLDLPDAYSLYWKRRVESSRGFKKIFNKIEYNRVKNYEERLNSFDMTLVCSKEDAYYLEDVQHINNVKILPNGVDTSQFFPAKNAFRNEDNFNILFTGNMDYAPNVDAVQYFVKDIFPLIKKAIPESKFIIAGQRPVKDVLELQNDDITVTGFIPELRVMYHKAAIVVAPLRFGAGTQNKVLEAMACGIPVVTRNIGFEGLGVASGEGIILATEVASFANACIKLLEDKNYASSMGDKAAKFIAKNYDWYTIGHQLEQYFSEIIKNHNGKQ